MARAHACVGQIAEAQRYHQLAEKSGMQIAEEDRRQFQKDLTAGPRSNLNIAAGVARLND